MSGMLSWTIDDAFKAMVNQAVSQKAKICFVKDHGVYLMSFGKKLATDNKVVYANGFDPNKEDFDTWYDKAHRTCGGDDFREELDTAFFQKIIGGNAKTFKIKLTTTKMTMEASR
jgi:hypothetical protein